MRIALAALTLVLASCAPQAPEISITDAEVVTTPMGGAGYMVINNAGGADRLVGVEAEGFATAEVHRTTNEDGISRMRPAGIVEIPANSLVVMERGGLHLMLMGPQPTVADPDIVTLTLRFEIAGDVEVAAPIAKPSGAE